MKPNRPRTRPTPTSNRKQVYALIFFIISFIFASWYAPEIEPEILTQQPATQIKYNRRSCTIFHARKIVRVFYCLFIPQATARSSHRKHKPPHARGSIAKILKIKFIPLNLLINLQIKTTFSFLLR